MMFLYVIIQVDVFMFFVEWNNWDMLSYFSIV